MLFMKTLPQSLFPNILNEKKNHALCHLKTPNLFPKMELK
jgi:hypothetical protein